jgi:hypothetical protein
MANVRTNHAVVWKELGAYCDEFDLTRDELDQLAASGDVEIHTDRGRYWARTAPRRDRLAVITARLRDEALERLYGTDENDAGAERGHQ